jgi:hypothetical protein
MVLSCARARHPADTAAAAPAVMKFLRNMLNGYCIAPGGRRVKLQ